MSITLTSLMQQRRDSAANWTANNPTLLDGEIGYETDTGKIKIGNGSDAWTALSYAGLIPGSGLFPYSQLLMPAGSNSAPSITFDGDSDTGIYSPSANQVALSTGGTGRLFIDSSGNVGIGTSVPGTGLEIKNDTASTFYDTTIDTSLFLSGTPGAGNGNFGGSIGFSRLDSAGRISAAIAVKQTTTDADQCGLSFFTHSSASTGASLNESFVIDHAGNVGIGTSSPTEKLEVAGNVILDANNAKLNIKSGAAGTTGAVNFTFNTDSSVFGTLDLPYDTRTTKGLRLWSGYPLTLETNATNLPIVFNQGTSERLRIDSAGRLLVGTSSASIGQNALLSVNSTSPANVASISRQVNDSAGPRLYLTKTRGSETTIVNNNDVIGEISFNASDGVDVNSTAAKIYAAVDGTPGTNDMPGRLVFSTTADGASSPTDRMRIRQTGAIDTYTTAPAAFQVRNSTTNAGNVIFGCINAATNTANGTQVFVVRGDGDVENANNSYTGLSDIKLKENIADANTQWDDIKSLRVRNYNFKPDTNYSAHTQIGLIAQEVELVSPGLVSESPDRDEEGNDLGTVTKSVNYSVLYMKAVKALQEAMERIEALEARLTDAGL